MKESTTERRAPETAEEMLAMAADFAKARAADFFKSEEGRALMGEAMATATTAAAHRGAAKKEEKFRAMGKMFEPFFSLALDEMPTVSEEAAEEAAEEMTVEGFKK